MQRLICTVIAVSFPFKLLAEREMRILVYPFENTGTVQYSWLSAGMTDSTVSDLLNIRGISVITDQDRRKALKEIALGQTGLLDEKTTAQLGRMTGADLIFTGSYVVIGNQIRVITKLVTIESGVTTRSAKLDGTINDIFGVQDKIVFSLIADAQKIDLANLKLPSVTDDEKKHIEEKPRPQQVAYELYSKGLVIQDTNPKQALEFFKQAFTIDPTYADALARSGWTAGNTLSLFDEAIGYLNRAMSVYENRGEATSRGYAALVNNIGVVYGKKGESEHSLECYLKAQKGFDRLGLQNTDDYADLMNNIGLVQNEKGELDHALVSYAKSQQIRDSNGLHGTEGYATLMMNIWIFFENKGQLDLALQYYNLAQQKY